MTGKSENIEILTAHIVSFGPFIGFNYLSVSLNSKNKLNGKIN